MNLCGLRCSLCAISLALPHTGEIDGFVLILFCQILFYATVHLFRKEIELTRVLLQALQATGYRGNERILSPRQVQVIEEFLGEP